MEKHKDTWNTRSTLSIGNELFSYFSLEKLSEKTEIDLTKLPFSIKILLENMLRNEDGQIVTENHIKSLGNWPPEQKKPGELPFMPARVLMQDFTGVPAVVDLAAMRDAVTDLGANADLINPHIPVDLVIDHSVQVDNYGSNTAFEKNAKKEFERNHERYAFLKWGQNSFKNFSVVPPATGICHQVNLEYLAKVVFIKEDGKEKWIYPDTLVGLDSHTTMINSLGVLGWGVGGIEAEAVMLGQPYYMLTPQVIGFELTGRLPVGTTATDLVLTITEILRNKGVVGKFIEFYGEGLDSLSLPDRATISNMTPEFGATMTLFPVDKETLNYLRLSGRSEAQIALVESYFQKQGLFRTSNTQKPEFSDSIELDLSTVVPCLAGPKRPQDPIPVTEMQSSFLKDLNETFQKKDRHLPENSIDQELKDGSVVIASITSCTNTSNPSVLVGAALLAKKALEKGLKVKPWVKTSFAPGSKVVTEYLQAFDLLKYLEALKFHIIAYGCTTCIGNSGPLDTDIESAIKNNGLVVASVLSGNRNFEGRINPLTRANYLASPILVVAYAITGTVNINLGKDPIGNSPEGEPVYLKDIWPKEEEIEAEVNKITPKMFTAQYNRVYEGDENWKALETKGTSQYQWDPASTYIKNPPFFQKMKKHPAPVEDIIDGRILALLEDSITTDHISPAGAIPIESPASLYLEKNGIKRSDFNSFGSRRGNHEVMMRGTFGNVRLKNKLVPGIEGGMTRYLPANEQMPIYDAAMKYQENKTPLVVIAGKEYGTGSSRDWAAKGTLLLGVKAVIAESFERIHRSNLVAMGVLPLQFTGEDNQKTLGIKGDELIRVKNIENALSPNQELTVEAISPDGTLKSFSVINRIDTVVETEYYKHGGILPFVLRQMIKEK